MKERNIIKIAALSAIAFVVMLFEFPIPPFPTFLKIDLSDIPALIGTFTLGPIAGLGIELLKNILHLLLKANEGSPIGELANFIVGAAFVVPAGLIYKLKKSRKQALLGIFIGIISMVIVAVLCNYFIFIPLYAPALLESGAWKYLVLTIMPFNAVKGLIIGLITLLLYKKISPILH